MRYREKLQFVEDEIAKGIKTMKTKGDRNKSSAFAVRVSSAVLGAIVTVALGLQITSLTTELKNLALICGALISVVNAVDSVVGYRALWIKQKLTLAQLYDLRNEIDFYKAGLEDDDQISDDQISEFFKRYQAIWETASSEWMRLRKEQEQDNTAKAS